VVEYTPYALAAGTLVAEAGFFAARGYNAVVCQVRGAGLSGGTWNHAASPQDGLDVYDIVEWLATQSFSDGRVGQFGGSYGGATSYQGGAEQPPHLLATAPMISPGSLYQDVIYPGGIKTTERGDIDVWPVTAQLLSLGRINADDEYAANRAHPTYDDYWQQRAITPRVSSIKVPILGIGAWDDANFRSGMLANIEAALDGTWAIYGQWPHLSPVSYEAQCDTCVPEPLPSGVTLAWFDHWVMQSPDVPLPLHPVFLSEEGPRGVGRGWREVAWNPNVSSAPSYELGSDGLLAPAATTMGMARFHEPAEPDAPGGAMTFTTAPLDVDHVLLGHAALHLRASLTASDANFYVELIDVDSKGDETLVNDGFLKASHRNSDTTPEPVTPGAAIDYVVPIRADHYRFVAGDSLRLRISGGKSTSLVPVAEPVDIAIQAGVPSALYMSPGW
jgi:predicted acyl esterase